MSADAVEARVLNIGDVVVTSDGWRLRVVEWALHGNRVQLRYEMLRTPHGSRYDRRRAFSVPLTTRFLREN